MHIKGEILSSFFPVYYVIAYKKYIISRQSEWLRDTRDILFKRALFPVSPHLATSVAQSHERERAVATAMKPFI